MKGILCSLVLSGLLVFSANDAALAKSYSSRSSSSSSSSRSSSIVRSSPSSSSSSGRRVNSTSNRGTQTSTIVKSNSSAITNPVKATYTPKSTMTTTKPSNSIVVDKKHVAPNPENKPTETRYVSRKGSDNKTYSVQVVVPVGSVFPSYTIGDSYFPTTARTTVIYDNTNVDDVDNLDYSVGDYFTVVFSIIVIGFICFVAISVMRSL